MGFSYGGDGLHQTGRWPQRGRHKRVSTKLNGIVPAKGRPTKIGDYNDDGTPDLMVKFDRASVASILKPGDKVEIKITANLIDGAAFRGADTIRVIEKKDKKQKKGTKDRK